MKISKYRIRHKSVSIKKKFALFTINYCKENEITAPIKPLCTITDIPIDVIIII